MAGGATCLWFDEIFGVHAAAWHGWGGMWRFVALDLIHPPLFYAVLKVWAGAVGAASAWRLRLLPVVLSFAAVVPLVSFIIHRSSFLIHPSPFSSTGAFASFQALQPPAIEKTLR